MALASRLSKHNVSGANSPHPEKPAAQDSIATVGCIVGRHGNVTCPGSTMLTDVADLLIEGDRSAAAIVSNDGTLLGVITENDIVQAYEEGTKFNYMITAAVWLQGGRARCPTALTPETTVLASTPLFKAAEDMRAHALSGAASSRHLIVADGDGQFQGVLSALDLARALCTSQAGMEEVHRRVGSAAVSEVMKPRAALATCLSTATFDQCLGTMLQSHQNCVLVMDAGSHEVLGVVTPRDALRAFAEHTTLNVQVGRWLRGLQSDMGPRQVRADSKLTDAAWLLAAQSVHHLLVLSTSSDEIEGVLSSSDVAQAIGSAERVVPGCGPVEE